MTNGEIQLMNQLGGVNAFEDHYTDSYSDNAPGPSLNQINATKSMGGGALPGAMGSFVSQFDLTMIPSYFTVASSVYTSIAPAALGGQLKTKIPAFIFGFTDFEAGYPNMQTVLPVQGGWKQERIFVYGKDWPATSLGVLSAEALAKLTTGDLVIPYTATIGTVNYCCLMVIHCANVAYATLLNGTSADKFMINKLRYTIQDTSASGLSQLQNSIFWSTLSIFGKTGRDSITPSSQKNPQNFQPGVIDMDIVKNITKEVTFGSFINFDNLSVGWSIFVSGVTKA